MKKGDKLGRTEVIMIGIAAAAAAAVSVGLSMPGKAQQRRTVVSFPEKTAVTAPAETAPPAAGTAVPVTESVNVTAETTETISVSATAETFLFLDINTASAEELAQLPGIGEVLAGAIISYRQAHGRFLNPEEIMEVSGIGEGIFSGIREHIYVVDPVYPPEPEPPRNDPQPDAGIPEVQEETAGPEYPVNINTADAEALLTLPGVDEELAAKIIKLREDIGGFTNTYELLLVEGMTEKHAAELVPLTVTGTENSTSESDDTCQ
ncbi:MAG: helix-hairpin-helix domain-containing protein [Ruminococcus sp.]|nr:helix-hairpin-helix domain-containing protein [Ruminococcus sp.]